MGWNILMHLLSSSSSTPSGACCLYNKALPLIAWRWHSHNNGYMNAPQLYVIHTLPILFTSSDIWRSTIFLEADSHRRPICKESHYSFTRVITEDINPLIYLGHAARLCEEIFHVTNTTIKGFLLPLGCIKSSISQMWTQKIFSSPTPFDLCKKSLPEGKWVWPQTRK